MSRAFRAARQRRPGRNRPERSAPGNPARAKYVPMRFFPVLIVALLSTAAFAQAAEDEAHRADRRQTEALNRSVQRSVDRRNAADAAKLARYRDAETAYERQRAEWRRRVAACEDGDTRACDPY